VTELQCLWSFVRCPKPISAARSHECEESKAIKLSDGVSQLSPPLKSHECSIIISPIAYKVAISSVLESATHSVLGRWFMSGA
jgi:hypothetical protein